MPEDGLKYEKMVEGALRSVVRQALDYAADNGLPGNHHYYITFRTDSPGVEIPVHLSERYPIEMTIVLQHQFWGLQVNDEAFSVTLSFANVPERLTIPLEAISAFADPSVRFGLQFESEDTDEDTDVAEEAENQPADTAESGADAASQAEESGASDEAATGRTDGGKVITLDVFRNR